MMSTDLLTLKALILILIYNLILILFYVLYTVAVSCVLIFRFSEFAISSCRWILQYQCFLTNIIRQGKRRPDSLYIIPEHDLIHS